MASAPAAEAGGEPKGKLINKVKTQGQMRLITTTATQRRLQDSFILHAPTFTAFCYLVIAGVSFARPQEFMPEKYVERVYYGYKVRRAPPIVFLTGALAHILSSLLLARDLLLEGHFAGVIVSYSLGMGFMVSARASWIYAIIGTSTMAFGNWYHRHRLRLITNDAPFLQWRDFSDIRQARAKRKVELSMMSSVADR